MKTCAGRPPTPRLAKTDRRSSRGAQLNEFGAWEDSDKGRLAAATKGFPRLFCGDLHRVEGSRALRGHHLHPQDQPVQNFIRH